MGCGVVRSRLPRTSSILEVARAFTEPSPATHCVARSVRLREGSTNSQPLMQSGGPVPTSVDAFARALARRDGSRIQPSGAHAANLLGISTQVPVRAVYLTDGPSRSVKVGNRKVVFKHVQAKDMVTSKRISGTVIHALRWTGRRSVDERTVASLRRTLSASDRSQLLRDLRFAPGWIAEAMRQIATDS